MENATNNVPAQSHSVSKLQALFARPDFAALAGVVFVFILFSFVASDTGMFAIDGVLNWKLNCRAPTQHNAVCLHNETRY
ncbi:hypothetical protein GCM10011357_26140 [Lacimicrobium alkaliphilum]|uniref:Uncharacterized protein n=2 Tax=Lacimicrobium alkaliphilum TaxID=1526571 RepID=A0ABQ1RKE0_9ALTE|nr:hypothetical protein GCM10011357_26140 [Lacimicrobium alkaliphilum]